MSERPGEEAVGTLEAAGKTGVDDDGRDRWASDEGSEWILDVHCVHTNMQLERA